MFNPIQWQDWYKVKLASIILPWVATDEAEYYFDVTEAVSVEQFVVYIDFQDATKKDVIEIHRTSLWWTRFHYYQYNRSNPTVRHWIEAFCQINSMAAYWNILSKNVDAFWRIRKLTNPWKKVKIYWWKVTIFWTTIVTASDKVLDLSEWDNYIYYDYNANDFLFSPTQPSWYDIMWLVVVTSWNITNITDYRSFNIDLKNSSTLNKLSEIGWMLAFNWIPITDDPSALTTNWFQTISDTVYEDWFLKSFKWNSIDYSLTYNTYWQLISVSNPYHVWNIEWNNDWTLKTLTLSS